MCKLRKLLICVSIILVLLAAGCSDAEKDQEALEYYDNSRYISIDVVSGNVLCFDIVLFTKEKVNSVECIGLAGEGISAETFNVSVINNTIDIYREHKYKNLYCSDWMIECNSNDENTNYVINEIELMIDGAVRKITFDKPLEYNTGMGNDIFNEELEVYSFPNEFASSLINSGEYVEYSFVANKKLEIKEIYTESEINPDVKVFLNENRKKEYSLPLQVEAGTKIDMEISYSSNKLNRFNYVLTNLYVTYIVDGREYTRKGVIVFSPTSPVDGQLRIIDSYIDYVLSK